MQFSYMRNSKGPKIDPCGTPNIIFEGSDKQFSKFTLNNRFETYDLNQSIV